MAKVDMELKQAFANLQNMTLDTTHKVKLLDKQVETLKREKLRASFTKTEISQMEPTCVMYESIGRMFLMKPRDEIVSNLDKQQQVAEEKIKTFENNKAYLEKCRQEAENNLRELVQQKK